MVPKTWSHGPEDRVPLGIGTGTSYDHPPEVPWDLWDPSYWDLDVVPYGTGTCFGTGTSAIRGTTWALGPLLGPVIVVPVPA